MSKIPLLMLAACLLPPAAAAQGPWGPSPGTPPAALPGLEAPAGLHGARRAGAGGSNVVFLHPDGSGLNHWQAARMYWAGPDGHLQWDRLPHMAVYRGHMADQLTGTSNGGATTHAFGVKVQGPDSYGEDRGRAIRALSGFPGSILREAAHRGHPVGVVNDGDVNGEPGTGAFLAETDTRGEPAAHALQILGGRPGFDGGTPGDLRDGEPDPVVVLGGGERFFVPEGAPRCTEAPTLAAPRLECYLHRDPVNDRGPARSDGRNLLEEAAADGWTVVRTRAELEALAARVRAARHPADPWFAPKVLGLFAADDLFNDEPEERLLELGLVRGEGDPPAPEGEKGGRLVIWGARPGDPEHPFSADPPTVAEMTELALLVLDRRARLARKPFALVVEVESSDNLANRNNAIGTLRALKRADDTIGVARAFESRGGAWRWLRPGAAARSTLLLTAADSDAGSMQVMALRAPRGQGRSGRLACTDPEDPASCTVGSVQVNPTGLEGGGQAVALDGVEGRGSAPFLAEPDALLAARPLPRPEGEAGMPAAPLPFAIAWSGTPDVAGGVLSRAQGAGAALLTSRFSGRFDNTDVYRMLYGALFGRMLPGAVGRPAPGR